jgi:23S rRNA (uracil1939-C5)-methyltransferase
VTRRSQQRPKQRDKRGAAPASRAASNAVPTEQITAVLEIASLSAGGDGVARHEGLVVFTPRTAPGDRVRASVEVSGRIGRGHVLEVEEAGPSRVTPPCPHYVAPDQCGGCQWQHVDLVAQREAKRAMVRDAFARIAKREVPLPELMGGDGWRYRRSLTLAIRREESGRVFAGLRAYDDPEAVFDLHDCLITAPEVMTAWRAVLAAAKFLPDAPRLRGTVRVIHERPHLVIEGGTAWETLGEFLDAVPTLAAVWWHAEGRRRRLVADRRQAGEPGGSFAQVNPEMAEQMHRAVVERVMHHAPRTVVDLFSGAGDTAVALTERGVQVAAVELDEEASAFAASRLPAGSRAIAARAEDAIASLLPADVVVLNPPRAGVDARITAALEASVSGARGAASERPRAILYVSCDPATLARDVARLPSWRVEHLACYDLFPQTAHVETVCELRPKESVA